jgi:hypothetical protein
MVVRKNHHFRFWTYCLSRSEPNPSFVQGDTIFRKDCSTLFLWGPLHAYVHMFSLTNRHLLRLRCCFCMRDQHRSSSGYLIGGPENCKFGFADFRAAPLFEPEAQKSLLAHFPVYRRAPVNLCTNRIATYGLALVRYWLFNRRQTRSRAVKICPKAGKVSSYEI